MFALPWMPSLSFIFLPTAAAGAPGAGPATIDPAFKRTMVYLFVGTRGGRNRISIVRFLKSEPSNPNKVSEKLSLDYKTVQHHLKVLVENGVLISSAKDTYGAVYFLTPYFERYYESISGMWAGFG